ncbi:MAG: DinB family protein [Bacteroidota bacterium]
MNTSQQLAKHLKEVHIGGNWTWSNLKDNLADVSWKQATTKIQSFNTIAALVYHIHYFVAAAIPVLKGEALDAHDKYSFDCPPIESDEDWNELLDTLQKDAEKLSELIAQLPEEKLWQTFWDEKYGNYFRNLLGTIEHTHYHLGQIVILKKLILENENKTQQEN